MNTVIEWQLCPKCNGEKKIPGSGTSVFDTCDICYGEGKLAKPFISTAGAAVTDEEIGKLFVDKFYDFKDAFIAGYKSSPSKIVSEVMESKKVYDNIDEIAFEQTRNIEFKGHLEQFSIDIWKSGFYYCRNNDTEIKKAHDVVTDFFMWCWEQDEEKLKDMTPNVAFGKFWAYRLSKAKKEADDERRWNEYLMTVHGMFNKEKSTHTVKESSPSLAAAPAKGVEEILDILSTHCQTLVNSNTNNEDWSKHFITGVNAVYGRINSLKTATPKDPIPPSVAAPQEGFCYVEVPVEKEMPKISTYFLCKVIPNEWNTNDEAEVFYDAMAERFLISPNDRFIKVTHWLKRIPISQLYSNQLNK